MPPLFMRVHVLNQAGRDIRPVPLLLLCLILIVANVGIFVLALKIQIPLWPAL